VGFCLTRLVLDAWWKEIGSAAYECEDCACRGTFEIELSWLLLVVEGLVDTLLYPLLHDILDLIAYGLYAWLELSSHFCSD
jgi:hypothetical protein